jgi:CheY-like chemotaxis protein
MADLISSTTGPQVKVTVDAPDDLPTAKADPNQLEMALLNLAVNARDAMPSGGILRIGATVERISSGHSLELPAGPYVRLSVADTGTGMDAATAARAIEPFFSTKGVGRGTGLGLSMVHGLASQLGGALTIRSQPGLGTDVMLWLPISDAPLKARDLATEQQSFHGLGTVLLVDDETLVRASTAEMLKDFGYSVVEAASAEEALSLHASGFKPKLLVTDHLMPGMNGTDLIARMRQAQPSLIALLISGYAEVDGIDPNVPRLTKPFRHADLGTILATLTRQVEGSGATSVEAG